MTHEALLALLADMSLEEKIGQMTLINDRWCLDGQPVPLGPAVEMNLTQEQLKLAGVFGCSISPEPAAYARLIRSMTAAHPHHIPPLLIRDVIHGFRTIFPLTLAVGCTFDEKYAEIMGRVSATEAAASGLHATVGPMMDVARDPRWGRVLETPSESPVLTAAMSAATVRGLRGEGVDRPDALAACAKHFAAYGLCQAGQEYAPVDVSRAELYNTYLPPFRAALDAGCDMVMTAFVAVDQVPCVCNDWLQNRVLRGLWGHKQAVTIADYDDVKQLMYQGVAADLKECAKLAVEGGLDIDFLSLAYMHHLKELVEEGTVAQEKIDAACLRILELKNRLGLFEKPVKNEDPLYADQICHAPEHRRLSLETALRSCVLMKNEGVLPLKPGTKVYLAGDHADEHDLLGAWAMDGSRPETETLREAFAREKRIQLVSLEEADVILLATGEFKPETGESTSKAYPFLHPEQQAELEALAKTGKPVAVLLFCGRPLILTDALPCCGALLNAWFPGSMGAEALRMLVMGDCSPSGHLSMTFPHSVGQIPIHHDRLTSCRPRGCRGDGRTFNNAYIDEENEPLFPFGFGLSYTDFALENPRVDGESVRATVRNRGDRDGETVVQLYGYVRHARTIRPVRTLIGWQRMAVPAGETVEIALPVRVDRLQRVDCDNRPVEMAGMVDLYLGFDSQAKTRLEYCIKAQ